MHLILGVSAYTHSFEIGSHTYLVFLGCILHRFKRVSLVFVLLLTEQLLIRHTDPRLRRNRNCVRVYVHFQQDELCPTVGTRSDQTGLS